jgi:hypothetical protein
MYPGKSLVSFSDSVIPRDDQHSEALQFGMSADCPHSFILRPFHLRQGDSSDLMDQASSITD